MEGQRQILGTPVPFEYAGKAFQVPPWTLEQECEFAAWVESRAERRLEAKRRDMKPADYERRERDLRRDIDAGLYEWGGEIVVGAWNAPGGQKQLAYLTLHALDRSVTPRFVEALFNDRPAWKKLWDILLRLNFPPEPAPETQETEQPETDAEAEASN